MGPSTFHDAFTITAPTCLVSVEPQLKATVLFALAAKNCCWPSMLYKPLSTMPLNIDWLTTISLRV
ncbi:hypothetical protein D9M68_930540 [compost metagenome]